MRKFVTFTPTTLAPVVILLAGWAAMPSNAGVEFSGAEGDCFEIENDDCDTDGPMGKSTKSTSIPALGRGLLVRLVPGSGDAVAGARDSGRLGEAVPGSNQSGSTIEEHLCVHISTCAASLEIGNLPMVSYFHLRRFHNDTKTTLFLGC